MLTIPVHSRTAWGNYFPGTPYYLQSNVYDARITPSNTNLYILNCLFRSISSSNGGGALYCSGSVTYLLVESTSFFSCRTSGGYGGAIYFSNTGSGQSVLHEVCGYDCYTTYTNPYHQFAYIRVNNVASSKNYINYTSIVRCVNENSGSHYILHLGNGKICCPSINISMNKCQYQQLYCLPYGDSNSVTCSFSYSSFTDNRANGFTCLLFFTSGAKYELKSCNILRNSQGSLGSEGTIYSYGSWTIEDSCILENKATYILRSSSSSYTITVSNCTLDSTSSNGFLTIQNTITKSFIIDICLLEIATQNMMLLEH
jgi:hypothetical protein